MKSKTQYCDYFKKIYRDENNLYYQNIITELQPDVSIYSQLKSIINNEAITNYFNIWAISLYAPPPLSNLAKESLENDFIKLDYTKDELQFVISKWETLINTKKVTSAFTKRLRIRHLQNNIEIYFLDYLYCQQLTLLTTTAESSWKKKIITYLKYQLKDKTICELTDSEATYKLERFLIKDLIPAVSTITQISNNPNVPCYSYINLNEFKRGETVAWKNFLDLFQDDESRGIFKAWVYGIFKDDNYSRQICWIQGVGQTGKSTIMRVLAKYLTTYSSNFVQSIENKMHEDKHTMASYENTRLAIIADCTDSSLVARESIKNMTGGDIVSIRQLSRQKKSSRIYCKVLVTSNRAPFVKTNEEHEISRMLYFKLNQEKAKEIRTSWDVEKYGTWEEKLYQEVESFIASCEDDYIQYVDLNTSNFAIPTNMVEELESNRAFFRVAMDYWFDKSFKDDIKAYPLYFNELMDDYIRFMKDKLPTHHHWWSRRIMMELLATRNVDYKESTMGMNNAIIYGKIFDKKNVHDRITVDHLLSTHLADEYSNYLRQLEN